MSNSTHVVRKSESIDLSSPTPPLNCVSFVCKSQCLSGCSAKHRWICRRRATICASYSLDTSPSQSWRQMVQRNILPATSRKRTAKMCLKNRASSRTSLSVWSWGAVSSPSLPLTDSLGWERACTRPSSMKARSIGSSLHSLRLATRANRASRPYLAISSAVAAPRLQGPWLSPTRSSTTASTKACCNSFRSDYRT